MEKRGQIPRHSISRLVLKVYANCQRPGLKEPITYQSDDVNWHCLFVWTIDSIAPKSGRLNPPNKSIEKDDLVEIFEHMPPFQPSTNWS